MDNNKETILKYIQALQKRIKEQDIEIKSLNDTIPKIDKYRIIAFILSVFLMISTGINISLLIK
jgi:hypothetical protein